MTGRDNIDDAQAIVAALRAEVVVQRELLKGIEAALTPHATADWIERGEYERQAVDHAIICVSAMTAVDVAQRIDVIRTHLAGAAPKPQAPTDTRRFPVLNQQHCRPRERLAMPRDVPWAFAESFRAQAERNHGQTLERLAERGGLSPQEMWLAAHGRRLLMRDIDERAAVEWLAGAAVPAAEGHAGSLTVEYDDGTSETTVLVRKAGAR
jgi:hypothetical protein